MYPNIGNVYVRCIVYTSLCVFQGLNSFHYASTSGNTEGMIHLLRHGQATNTPTQQEEEADQHQHKCPTTPVHLAAANGHQNILFMLFSSLSDPNILDAKGQTPLHLAAAKGHKTTLETLLEKGAHVAVHSTVSGHTPIHAAAANGNTHCLRLLIENTEDATVIDARDFKMRTPLMVAVEAGHPHSTEYLLANGADVNAVDGKKKQSCHFLLPRSDTRE